MKKVKSSVRHDPENGSYGDCHRACFCTILGLEPDQVPHFYDSGDQVETSEQLDRIRSFLKGRGLVQGHVLFSEETASLEQVLNTTRHLMPGVPLILGGRSSVGCGHSVVLLDGEIFNDPSGSGIVGPMPDGHFWVTFFSPEPGRPAVQEPVAWMNENPVSTAFSRTAYHGWTPLYAHPAAPAQPVAQFLATEDGEFNGNAQETVSGGRILSFEPGFLRVNVDGSGYFCVPDADMVFEDDRQEGPDGPEGSVHWIAKMDASEIVALRDFLNEAPAQPVAPEPVSTATGDRSEIDRLVAVLRTGRHGGEISNKAADWIEKLAASEFEAVMKLNATPAPVEAALAAERDSADAMADLLSDISEGMTVDHGLVLEALGVHDALRAQSCGAA